MSSKARINASRAISRVNNRLFIDSSVLPGEDKKELPKVLARELLEQWKQMRIWAMQVGAPDILSRDMHRYEVSYLRQYRNELISEGT